MYSVDSVYLACLNHNFSALSGSRTPRRSPTSWTPGKEAKPMVIGQSSQYEWHVIEVGVRNVGILVRGLWSAHRSLR